MSSSSSSNISPITTTIETFFDKKNAPFASDGTYQILADAKKESILWKRRLITGIVVNVIFLVGGILLLKFGPRLSPSYNALVYKIPCGISFACILPAAVITLRLTYPKYKKYQKHFKTAVHNFRQALEPELKQYVASNASNTQSKNVWVVFKYLDRQLSIGNGSGPAPEIFFYHFTDGTSYKCTSKEDSIVNAIDALTFINDVESRKITIEE